MAITKIKVENLTVFEEMEMDIDANVNVIIGENGTGKTQLLKMIYASWIVENKIFEEIFKVKTNDLIRSKDFERSSVNILRDDESTFYKMCKGGWERKFYSTIDSAKKVHKIDAFIEKIVFIPAKDMLTHSPGFLSLIRERKMPFDETLVDIVSKASLPELREVPELAKNIMPKLEQVMGGIVVIENDEFFILKNDGQKVSFSVEAEGMKKIGLLWKLLMTGNIKEDTILLWDEPEANINPKLIPLLAKIILELGRNGVQIFLATHDYFLPKYIEVQSSDADKVAFHALYTTDHGVKCETDTKFAFLDENAIIDEKIKLYEAEIDKVMDNE